MLKELTIIGAIVVAIGGCVVANQALLKVDRKTIEIKNLAEDNFRIAMTAQVRMGKVLDADKAELDSWKGYANQLSEWGDRCLGRVSPDDELHNFLGHRKPVPPSPAPTIITVTNVQIYYYERN